MLFVKMQTQDADDDLSDDNGDEDLGDDNDDVDLSDDNDDENLGAGEREFTFLNLPRTRCTPCFPRFDLRQASPNQRGSAQ